MFGLSFLLQNRNPDIEFVTPITIDECKSRLTKELNLKPAILGLHPSHPVIERISDNRFLISRNQSFPFRDIYHPFLEGRLTATNDGTLVRGAFRLNGLISALIIVGFSLFFGMVASGVILNGAELGLLLIPIVFWAFLGLVIWFMSWFKNSKRDTLTDYLHSILTPITNGSR